MDRSCLGSAVRVDFRGIFRNSAGFFLSAFLGHITWYSDILLVELLAIYNGLIMAKKKMGIGCFVCYSYFLLCINLINGPLMNYRVYAYLIQDIIDLICNTPFSRLKNFLKQIRVNHITERHISQNISNIE